MKLRFKKNSILLRERYRRLKSKDPRRRLLEKKATVRLKSRLGWRHMVQREQPMDFKVEELKPPLPSWRETNLRFAKVQLEQRKD